VNLQKSQFPAHGLGRASCACLSKNPTISRPLHSLFNSVNLFNPFNDLSIWCFCLSLLIVFLCAPTWAADQGSSARAAGGFSHGSLGQVQKFRISDPELAREALANGAELIADYGAFQVFRANGELARKLARDPSAEDLSSQNVITLRAGHLNTTSPEVRALRKPVALGTGKRLHLVQFAGPIKAEWRAELEKTGVKVIDYIPNNAYLLYAGTSALQQMQAWAARSPYVQWEGQYLDDYKIHSSARPTNSKAEPRTLSTDMFAVQLVADDEANPATLKFIERLKLEPIRRRSKVLNYLNVIVRLPSAQLAQIAAQPEVISIQPYYPRVKMDERQDQIIAGNLSGSAPASPGYLKWLENQGFSQSQFESSGFVVDITDSGVDNGSTSPGHFGLYKFGDTNQTSRVIYNRLVGSPNGGSTIQGCDGHGTVNSHIIAGYNDLTNGFPHTDSAGYHYGLGLCPFIKIGSSVIFDPDMFTFPDYAELQSDAYQDGARISNNSWGANVAGDYDIDAQQYDALVRDAQPDGTTNATAGNQEMVIVFAAGNAGSGAQSVGSPGTGKNIITVGATESVCSLSTNNGGNNPEGNDGCSLTDADADSSSDIASYSARGPCTDGRKKPDLVAPGTHVSGGVAQESPPPPLGGTGLALSCFAASGICALPGGGMTDNPNNFFPLGQQFYTTSSGTSHSTPGVVGACALLRQSFINHSLTPPSPAMTKAYLMNSARYLNGVSANDPLWSNNQGMGAVNLGFALDSAPRILRDEISADKFTATGQKRSFTGIISDPSKPFRVTLTWTDAPGSTTGNAYNNDLDLTVTVGGSTYKGNVFNGAVSVSGGSADSQNNTESVFLPAGVCGAFIVTVTAANINSDGVPNEEPELDQDFALVIYNGTTAAVPVIAPQSALISAESCTPTNGAADPGETLTLAVNLQNLGLVDATNLTATLIPGKGVMGPSGPQNYGLVMAGGAGVVRYFTFTVSAACGDIITPTFQLHDGALDLCAVALSMQLGQLTNFFSQNFDSVVAPALPGGWTTSSTGSQIPWVTDVSNSDSAPNAAYSPDASGAGDNELVSPAIVISATAAQLTFRQSYSLENGFDGGVLEIKIGSADFTDIIAAGGSFVTGGYNQTLGSTSGNPLGGRQAWTGNSSGYITTTVNLPVAALSQLVQFKWRCGSDVSVSGSGWYVDSISITGHGCCGALAPPFASFNATPTNGTPPLAVTFHDTSLGSVTNRHWDFGSGFTTNTTATNFVFIYNSIGTDTVSLTVSGPLGTNTITRSNYIVVLPPYVQLASSGFSFASEGCSNNAVDPGETVTANFSIRNIGTVPTTNLVATLLSGGGISSPSDPQNFGVISGGAAVARPFTFTMFGNCGSSNAAILQLQDGTANLGTISFPFVIGQSSVLAENFDKVAPPALPAGWSTAASGGQSVWVTSSATSDTASNAVFSPDPYTSGVNELDTPTVTLPPSSTQLIFRHSFNLEASGVSTNTAFDGGVLEIEIGSNPFIDIIDAGGTFLAGGYNRTISPSWGNPLGGRDAWSGYSGGFITTIVDLPPAALGQTVQFRWLCGSDSSVASTGWYVDTVSVGGLVCCVNPPSITVQPQNRIVLAGQNATFYVVASGTAPLAYQWQFNGNNLSGATATNYTRSNVQPLDLGTYDVVISNSLGSITSTLASLTFASRPLLLAPQTTNGTFVFTLSGDPGFNYAIEATTNYSTWTNLAILTNATGEVPFIDTNIIPFRYRAYRARLIP
jgi:PKD repeat protein